MKETHSRPSDFSSPDKSRKPLPPVSLAALRDIQTTKTFPKGHEFFLEGQQPLGVYILYSGCVELSVTDAHGRQLVLRTVLPGDVLGLSAVVSGKFYEETAVASVPSRAGFVQCQKFCQFLENNPEAAFWVVQLLSDRVAATLDQLSCFRQQLSIDARH